MSKNVKPMAEEHAAIPVIFTPGSDTAQPRQKVAEKLIRGLLQDETFLQTLREIQT